MPRRRRKKSQCDGKPALIFTESPVNNQWNIPSPVCCALHPRTARAVPVDELDNSAWVSPQFNGTVGQSEVRNRSRRNLRRRKSPEGRSCKPQCTCGPVHDQTDGQGQKSSKYKSLEFVSHKKMAISVLDEVSIEENVSPKITNNLRRIKKRSTAAWSNHDIEHSPVLKRKVRRKSQHISNLGDENHGCEKGDSRRVTQNPIVINTGYSPLTVGESNVKSFFNDREFTGDENIDPPVKRLFSDTVHKNQESLLVTNSDEMFGYADNVSPRVVSQTDRCGMDGQTNSSCVDRINEQEDGIRMLRSHNLLQKYFDTTICRTPKISGSSSKVLVADTPVAEYGVSVRQRQMMSTKNKNS